MSAIRPVLPLCSFGNLFYFRLLMEPDVLIDTGENYMKQTWRNRYDIVAANGLLSLTIPVVGQQGRKIPVHEIQIDYTHNWPSLHWKTIVSAYASSPFFEHYADELQMLLENPPATLAAFNKSALRLMCEWIELDIAPAITEDYHKSESGETDLRHCFKPAKFRFSAFQPPSYIQVFSHKQPFHSNPSVLDLVFNLGPEAASYLRQIRLEASQIINLAEQSK